MHSIKMWPKPHAGATISKPHNEKRRGWHFSSSASIAYLCLVRSLPCAFFFYSPFKGKSRASYTAQNLERSFNIYPVWWDFLLADELLPGELSSLFVQSEIPAYRVKRVEKAVRLVNLSEKMCLLPCLLQGWLHKQCGLQPAEWSCLTWGTSHLLL